MTNYRRENPIKYDWEQFVRLRPRPADAFSRWAAGEEEWRKIPLGEWAFWDRGREGGVSATLNKDPKVEVMYFPARNVWAEEGRG